MIPTLIFYRNHHDVEKLHGEVLRGAHADVVAMIMKFNNNKQIPVMWVPQSMCTGWRTTLTADECLILFAGPRWSPEELLQASNRVSPSLKDNTYGRREVL